MFISWSNEIFRAHKSLCGSEANFKPIYEQGKFNYICLGDVQHNLVIIYGLERMLGWGREDGEKIASQGKETGNL